MNIKNAKDHLIRARQNISSALEWVNQEESKKEEEPVIFLDIPGKHRIGYISETKLREIIREEVKEYMKKEVHRNIFDIK